MFKVRTRTKSHLEVAASRSWKGGESVAKAMSSEHKAKMEEPQHGVKRKILRIPSVTGADMRIKQQRPTESSGGITRSLFGESIAEEIIRDAQASQDHSRANVFGASFAQETRSCAATVCNGSRGGEDKTSHRHVVKQKIFDALSVNRDMPLASSRDFEKLADRIEGALHEAFANNTREYTRKARSVLHNLNDAGNVDFGMMLVLGFIRPEEVPHLPPEQMASYEKLNAKVRLRKELMEEVRSDWELKQGVLQTTSFFICDGCGGSNTTYFQLQTRRCDEPATTYVMCVDCKKRWKC